MEGHYIFIKGKVRQYDISILNIYAPNTRALKFVKEMLLHLKSHIDNDSGGLQYPTLPKGHVGHADKN